MCASFLRILHHGPVCGCRVIGREGAAAWPLRSWVPQPDSVRVMVGVLRHEKPRHGVSPACRASNGAIPPVCWRRGRGSGAVRSRFGVVRSRFGEAWRPKCRPPRRKTPTMGVVAEVVCVVGTTVPGMVCRSHANPLLRALTRHLARQPAIPCLGGAAHAHISGLTRALADPRSH